jgi:hypothetical protein
MEVFRKLLNLIPVWIKALCYSFMAYLVVLFAIIVVDTFARKDFDFPRAKFISMVYLGFIGLFCLFALFLFHLKLKKL